jgi:hypothetical protein
MPGHPLVMMAGYKIFTAMWTTKIKHRNGQVVGMTHYFDNKVKVITDFREMTTRRFHGDVCVREYAADANIQHYVQFLQNVGYEKDY